MRWLRLWMPKVFILVVVFGILGLIPVVIVNYVEELTTKLFENCLYMSTFFIVMMAFTVVLGIIAGTENAEDSD